MGNYKLGVDSALMLKANSADEAIVKGINKLKLPELLRDVVSVTEFRRDIDIEFTTSAKYGRISYSGNTVFGDTTGQDQLKQYWLNNTEISDARLYVDLNNFVACDLANDADSHFQVVKCDPGEADKNGVYPYSGEMICGGRIAYFLAHNVDGATPTMAFAAGGTTITDSGSGFVTAGFVTGQTLLIEGSTSNDGQYLITDVAAGVITCAAASFTVEAAIGGTTLHGGTL